MNSRHFVQENGQAESSNKSIIKIIKRMLDNNKKVLDSKLRLDLWVEKITVKKTTVKSLFEPVYGSQARIPMHNLLPVYKFILQEDMDIPEPMEERMEQLEELDEIRSQAQEKNMNIQSQMKHLFDKREKNKKFKVGDMVLMWNSRIQDKGKRGKFEALWLFPFFITSKCGEDSYYLQNMVSEDQEFLMHGQFLKYLFS